MINLNNIGINGFGRIGRSILRIIIESNSDLNVIAINDLGDRENLVYLFKHDSIMGVLDMHVELKDDDLIVGDRTIDVHIRKIREKIGASSFKTIKGVGYKFVS